MGKKRNETPDLPDGCIKPFFCAPMALLGIVLIASKLIPEMGWFFVISSIVFLFIPFSSKKSKKNAASNLPVKTEETATGVVSPSTNAVTSEEPKKDPYPLKLQQEEAKVQESILRRKKIFDSMTEHHVIIDNDKGQQQKQTVKTIYDLHYTKLVSRSPLSLLSAFTAIDIETTGLNPHSCDIIEISAVRFRSQRACAYFHSYVKPRYGIKEEAQRINGITSEMVADAPLIEQISDDFIRFIGKDNLVGHNLPFDIKFLFSHNIPFEQKNRKYYDTLAIARCAWEYSLVGYKLGDLTEPLGIYHPSKHSSLSDAFATGYLFIEEYQKITNFHYLDDEDIPITSEDWNYFREEEIRIPPIMIEKYHLEEQGEQSEKNIPS